MGDVPDSESTTTANAENGDNEPTPSIAETAATAVNGDEPEAPAKEKGIPQNIQLYEVFFGQVKNLVQAQHLPVQDTIALLVSLANLALNIYPERLDYVDQILDYANYKVREHANSADLHSPPAQQSLLALLQAPLKRYVSIFTALSLPTYVPLYQSQTYPTRRAVAGEVARTLLRNQTTIYTCAQLENVLEILRVLIKEGSNAPAGYPGVQQRARAMSRPTRRSRSKDGWHASCICSTPRTTTLSSASYR